VDNLSGMEFSYILGEGERKRPPKKRREKMMRWRIIKRVVKEAARIRAAKKTGVLKMGEGRRKKTPLGEEEKKMKKEEKKKEVKK